MGTNLMEAAIQWATRPADERFRDIGDLYLHTLRAAQRAKQRNFNTSKLEVVGNDGNLTLVTPDTEVNFNNWSFKQFSNRLGTPTDWLRRIPADLAAENMNHALRANPEETVQLYYDGESTELRACTTPKYARVKNHEVVKAVIDLGDDWVTAPARPAFPGQPGTRPATEADCYGSNHPNMGIKVGDPIADAGIYGGDRNIFIFRVNPKIRLDDGTDEGLGRGFFVRNSEVGDAFYRMTAFWYRYICGNHIVWGAEQVVEKKIKHIGSARSRIFDNIHEDLELMAQVDLKADEAMIQKAKAKELGSNEEEVIENIFEERKLMSKRDTQAAFDLATRYEDIDGPPTTAWGFAQGVTRLSQQQDWADERTGLDRVAGEIIALAN